MNDDYPELPDCLNRRLNGITPDRVMEHRGHKDKLTWTKKRNWAKLAKQAREKAKREGTTIKAPVRARRGA